MVVAEAAALAAMVGAGAGIEGWGSGTAGAGFLTAGEGGAFGVMSAAAFCGAAGFTGHAAKGS